MTGRILSGKKGGARDPKGRPRSWSGRGIGGDEGGLERWIAAETSRRRGGEPGSEVHRGLTGGDINTALQEQGKGKNGGQEQRNQGVCEKTIPMADGSEGKNRVRGKDSNPYAFEAEEGS